MRRIATWTIGLIALIVLALAPAAAAAQDNATSNVNPRVGMPGTRFAFVAFGFNSDEQVGVWVNTPSGTPMAIKPEKLNGANGDGRADWFWTAPDDAARGTWQMLAHGVDSGVERVIYFEVGGEATAPQPTATSDNSNVDPKAGAPGTRFAFVAFGFNGDEQVGVWVNTPSGTPMTIKPEKLNGANGDGRADWFWTAPGDAARGTWQMVAHGVDSGVERIIYFQIQ